VAIGLVAGGVHRLAEASQGAPGVLIERTLAIVAGQIISLSDVRTVTELGLVEAPETADPMAAVIERLIERTLILREVQRYAPSEPPDASIEESLARVRQRYETPLDFARVLEAGGFTSARLREWLRDDLRIDAYLGQRFASAGIPGEAELSAYYNRERAEFDALGLSFEAAVPLVRDRLVAERRRELITDWVAGLRRRAEVVELYRRP
jgi:hypothetical protein